MNMFWRKIFIISIVTICITSLQFSAAEAKAKKKKEPKMETVEKEEILKTAEEKLNNTQWSIKLIRIPAEMRRSSDEDTLFFTEGKVESKLLAKEGVMPTSYSLNLKGENIVIWETMQTDAKGNMAFWKGEIEGEKMRGVLSRQPKGKPSQDFTFVSIKKEIWEPEAEAAKPEEKKWKLW